MTVLGWEAGADRKGSQPGRGLGQPPPGLDGELAELSFQAPRLSGSRRHRTLLPLEISALLIGQ